MKHTTAFVDSNVIITSLISQKGASYHLLYKTSEKLTISSLSFTELSDVVERKKLDVKKLEHLITHRLAVVKLSSSVFALRKKYSLFVYDPNDAHIVAGAVGAKTSYLLTYNLRHFKIDLLKKDFGIITMTPAWYLQYLRSVRKQEMNPQP